MTTDIRVESGDWATLGGECESVRFEVFVDEQGVPEELELDEDDPRSVHFVAKDAAGRVIGCARLLPDGHIGRLAVRKSHRGCGAGGRILAAVLECARSAGFARVVLNAQTHAQGFYERYGFEAEGEVFLEAGIEHVTMTKVLGG